ncbi:uncharacterized protein LOC107042646 [Diachasma alloeum]|uniref:uncharacterized protein LOC107042646 n=1 Tax=Diachasma alloeum TaxID=454923 RepID=UPI0007383D3F|nr:uncharacterized protein LOC107042646 [Diachasma alloeum]
MCDSKPLIKCPPKMDFKLNTSVYSWAQIKKNYAVTPLLALQLGAAGGILFMIYHRTFVTTIDVQMGYQRWEMESKPRFIDLRNPRSLKLIKDKPAPAIALDNRYRLMRNEPMYDANGQETNEIGTDEPEVTEEEVYQKYGARRNL